MFKKSERLFIEMEVFKVPGDINMEILWNMDDETLFKILQVNIVSNESDNEYFWDVRIQRIYGGALMVKYKKNKTYKEIYLELRKQRTQHDLLYNSAKEGYLPIIKYLEDRGINITYVFMYAVEHGNYEVVEYLIGKGADIHGYKEEPLLTSIKNGHLDVVKLLIKRGANMYARSPPIFLNAVEYGHIEIVKYFLENDFLENGLDIHYNNDTMIIMAVLYNKLDLLKYLILKGANVNRLFERRVMIWVVADNPELLKYLVEEHSLDISHYPKNVIGGPGFYERLAIL